MDRFLPPLPLAAAGAGLVASVTYCCSNAPACRLIDRRATVHDAFEQLLLSEALKLS